VKTQSNVIKNENTTPQTKSVKTEQSKQKTFFQTKKPIRFICTIQYYNLNVSFL